MELMLHNQKQNNYTVNLKDTFVFQHVPGPTFTNNDIIVNGLQRGRQRSD